MKWQFVYVIGYVHAWLVTSKSPPMWLAALSGIVVGVCVQLLDDAAREREELDQ